MASRVQRQNFGGWYGRAGGTGPRAWGLGHPGLRNLCGLEWDETSRAPFLGGMSRSVASQHMPLGLHHAQWGGGLLFRESVTLEHFPGSFSDPRWPSGYAFCCPEAYKGVKVV